MSLSEKEIEEKAKERLTKSDEHFNQIEEIRKKTKTDPKRFLTWLKWYYNSTPEERLEKMKHIISL